jgi:ribosomal protein L7/L12
MNPESILLVVLISLVAGHFTLTSMMRKQRVYLRSLDIKLDALLKAQGIEWHSPSLSPEVQALALDQGKIAAIKLYRDEHPGTGLAEAKAEVEAFIAKKH